MAKAAGIAMLCLALGLVCAAQAPASAPDWVDIIGYGDIELYSTLDDLDLSKFTATDQQLAPYGYPSRYTMQEGDSQIDIITGLDYVNAGHRFTGSQCALQLTYFNGVLHHIMLESHFITEAEAVNPEYAVQRFCEGLLTTLMDKYGEAGIREAMYGSDHTYIIWEDNAGRELLYEVDTGENAGLWVQYSTPEFWQHAEERASEETAEDLEKF